MDIFTTYREENPNDYKKIIINFFKEKIAKEEKIKSNNHNINEGLYFPNYVQEILIIEKNIFWVIVQYYYILLKKTNFRFITRNKRFKKN